MTGLYWTGVVVAFFWFTAAIQVKARMKSPLMAAPTAFIAAFLWPWILGAWLLWQAIKAVWRHRVWIWRKTCAAGRGMVAFYGRRRDRATVEYHPDAQLARIADTKGYQWKSS